MKALGIDIGGSGIKGAIVETSTGEFLTERLRIPTPAQSNSKKLIPVIQELIDAFDWKEGPIGVGFPGVIKNNIILTAANLDDSMIGIDLASELNKKDMLVLNDADSAGFAEMHLGVGKPYTENGSVLLLTVGTGIGTVLFRNGVLVPNMELGHIEYKGRNAESYVAERARKSEELSWIEWGKRFNGYLQYMEFLLQPDFIILGGGGVKRPERFEDEIQLDSKWAFAHFGNRAGIIGAAVAAAEV